MRAVPLFVCDKQNATVYIIEFLTPIHWTQREKDKLIEKEKATVSAVVAPTSNYKDKYVHLIGQEAALEAARKTTSNKSYGIGEYIVFRRRLETRTIPIMRYVCL